MSVRAPLTKVALFVAVALVWATGQSVRAQDDAAAMIVRIESAQSPNRQGLDALTLQQVMERFRVRG